MRARNLKPSLFRNEFLAVADPLYTVIFEGLWCLADREGRLEDNPFKIHLAINPGRAFEGTEAALKWLESKKFIRRYRVAKKQFIHVITFNDHQNPHIKEPPSKLPEPTKSGASNGHAPDKPGASPVLAGPLPSSLIPDSGSLNPESGSRILESLLPQPRANPGRPRDAPGRTKHPEDRLETVPERQQSREIGARLPGFSKLVAQMKTL